MCVCLFVCVWACVCVGENTHAPVQACVPLHVSVFADVCTFVSVWESVCLCQDWRKQKPKYNYTANIPTMRANTSSSYNKNHKDS